MLVRPTRILTLWQPYATLIARGYKPCEYRTWRPDESMLPFTCAIHAAKRPMDMQPEFDVGAVMASFGFHDESDDFALVERVTAEAEATRGQIVCVVEFHAFRSYMGDWAWELRDVRRLVTPIPFRGGQGLRKFDQEMELE